MPCRRVFFICKKTKCLRSIACKGHQQLERGNWTEEMSFLVSAAKRQRSEVKISTLGAHDRKLFGEAKSKEVDGWLSTSTVCRILRHQVPTDNVLRCRWILSWKDAEEPRPSTTAQPTTPRGQSATCSPWV